MTARVRAGRYRTPDELLVPMAWHHPWTPTEAEMTDLFCELADKLNWSPRYHTHDSRRSVPGFPDWVLIHRGQRRILFVELKGFGGFATDEQRAFLAAINDAGGEAYLIGTTGDQAQDMIRIAALLRHRPAR